MQYEPAGGKGCMDVKFPVRDQSHQACESAVTQFQDPSFNQYDVCNVILLGECLSFWGRGGCFILSGLFCISHPCGQWSQRLPSTPQLLDTCLCLFTFISAIFSVISGNRLVTDNRKKDERVRCYLH